MKKKKRVAFIGDALDLQYAGIHFYTKAIIENIARLDLDNEYFVVRPQVKNDIENITEIIAPIHSFIPLHQRLRLFTTIPRLMKKHQIDIVIEPCHFGPFNLPKSIKRFTVIHDLTPVLFPEYHSSISHLFHKLFLPRILKNADKIITNSFYTRSDLEKHYPISKGKIEAIYLGKEANFIPNSKTSVLGKYNIQQPYFLYTGTLEIRKNLGVLIRAFEKFKAASKRPTQLVLVGKKGWKIDKVLKKIENSPFKKDIILTGYVEREDLPILYSMAQLFVYPSLYEGFGLPILEAMACGTTVVTSNTSSLPEVGGNAAFYFNPNDVKELFMLLLKLADNTKLIQEHQQLSLKQASLFSWEKAAMQFIEVFHHIEI